MLRRIAMSGAFLALILLVSAAAASAQSRWNINGRERHQQQRIRQGVRSGQLTSRETYGLERKEIRIDNQEARFRRSGDGLSPSERLRLEREQNRVSRDIYRQKHDNQHSPRP
ncbi:MAG: hypothetical protein ACRD43_04625 [Pyrinomonadaceae bacterium]